MSDVSSANLDAANEAILAHGTDYYINFCTGSPGGTGANESGETRQVLVMAASSGGTQASSDGQTWSDAVGGTYLDFGVWSAVTSGTYERGGTLTASISPPAGSEITIASGGISFTAS